MAEKPKFNSKKEAYQHGMKMYGYIPLFILLEHYERQELYEDCQAIKEVIEESEVFKTIKRTSETAAKNNDHEPVEQIPTRAYDGMFEDYLQAFWRTGNSGQVALSNLNYYCAEIVELALKAE